MPWPPSPAQQRAAHAYVVNVAEQFGLKHWWAEVAEWYEAGPDPDNSDAECFVATYTDRFTVHLYRPWWEADAETQRRIVVHELLHPHLDRAWTDVLAETERALPTQAGEMLERRTRHEVERCIERIAWAIAHFFPLPDLPRR